MKKLAPRMTSVLLIILGAFFYDSAHASGMVRNAGNQSIDSVVSIGDNTNRMVRFGRVSFDSDTIFIDSSGTDMTFTDGTNTAVTLSTLAGGGSPGGSNTNVQFNDSGSFGGDPSLGWDKTRNSLGISTDAGQSGIAFVISNDVGAVLANISHDGKASFKTTTVLDRILVVTQDTSGTADVFVDSEGSAIVYIDRGGTSGSRSSLVQWQTAGTKQFSMGPVSATDQIVIQDEGTNTMLTIADGGSTGNVTVTGTLAVNGGLPSSDVTGTVGINRGGTGFTSYTKGDLLVGVTQSSALNKLAVGSMGQILSVDTGSTTGVAWVAAPSAGGTPGGSNTQVQYNNSSSFGGMSVLTYDSAIGPRVTFGNTLTGTAAPSFDVAGSFRLAPFTLTDAANISVDVTKGSQFYVILGGTRRVMNPTIGGGLLNSSYRGMKITFIISQDATGSRKLSWDTRYQWNSDIPSYDASTTARTHDWVSFIFSDPSWDAAGVVRGNF